jgi:enoyl-CoA hydratase
MATGYETIRVSNHGPVARITLHRPERYNAIVAPMPAELRQAVEELDTDEAVRVIVLEGAGPGFCAGYDLEVYAATPGPNPGVQELPFDATVDLRMMGRNTEDFMALWRCRTPTIAQVHGAAIAGGSDIALCCDLVVAADDATFGYPPARVWGVPTTMMWIQRVGPERAKRLLFTGDVIDGREAARIGLILESVPADRLASHVLALATRIAGLPMNQLAMMKTVVNQAVDGQGLATTQLLATLFDGMARHTAEGLAFKARAEEVGWRQAVAERDAL